MCASDLVQDVSLEVHPGEVVGLSGPNGAGKTTFSDAVTGFVSAARGSISLGDSSFESLNATQRARLGLRRSFQSLELFDDISVEENIRAGSDLRASRRSWVTDLFWPGHHDLTSTAVAAVREFSLEECLDQTPEELPYGRRRLVRSEEHTSELQSLMRISYAGFRLKKKQEASTITND